MKFPQGEESKVILRRKNGLLHIDCHMYVCITASCKPNSLVIENRSLTVSRSPRVSPHSYFVGGVKFSKGEGSAVFHRKKNDLLDNGAT